MCYHALMVRIQRSVTTDPNIAEIASLIADPVRSAILLALLDGGELPASELAFRAGASPQSASGHLSKLVDGGLLAVTASGRQRLFRLASAEVGQVLETLQTVARPPRIVALDQSMTMQRLRAARSCYDHLAGQLGVAITDSFVGDNAIVLTGEMFEVTKRGERVFRDLGIDLDMARERPRSFARACLDWTERRPHLAGSLGAAILQRFLCTGWIARRAKDRSLRILPRGRLEIERRFGIQA